MKAMVVKKYGAIKDIEQIEIENPTAGSDEVLVKVKSAAVNPADFKVVTGKDGGKFIHSGKTPIRLGFDYSGVIEEVDSDVSRLAKGDDVFGFLPYSMKTTQGSFAEYVVVKGSETAKKPAAITHTKAASAATTGITALQCLKDIGKLKSGQKVLVNGASGGVGSYAVQMAKHFGAEVWGTASAANLDYIKSLGCDHPLDYKKTSLVDLPETFDIVFDAASNSSFGKCSGILAPKGVYITLLPSFGFLTGKIRSLFSSKRCAVCMVKAKSTDLSKLAEMLEKKEISAYVHASYPLAELQTAMETFKAGGTRGKIGIVLEE
jgi:NADPH:quinone reductase-like Zn-dependent oxidoreductase